MTKKTVKGFAPGEFPSPSSPEFRKPEPTVPTVAEYFKRKLGAELDPGNTRPDSMGSPYHSHFTIETGCGVECRAAIDAAAEILAHVVNAFGPLPGDARAHPKGHALRASIVDAARNVVLCYVYG